MTSLTNALPLQRGISNQICFLLKKFMREVHPWMIQIFGEASYAYIKSDEASIQRPGVFIYPTIAGKESYGSKYIGTIIMELHFSFLKQREDLAENVIQIAEDILLINLNQEFTQYMQQFMPGLWQFGKKSQVDYTKVYNKEAIVKLEFDFWVDLVAYQRGLQDSGCDITSPDKSIYYPALALREAIALMTNPPEVAFVTGSTEGELAVMTPTETVNLAINPLDNSEVLAVSTI